MNPFELLQDLVLEDGQRWIDRAEPFQITDAQAFLDGTRRRSFWLRPRGSSKSTDAGALLLVDAICSAPPRSRSYLLAVDEEQAALILDAMVGLIFRTKGLPVKVEANRIISTAPDTVGASVQVLASDGASSFGLRPRCVILDELAQWPESKNHKRLLSSMLSSLPKVPGARLIACTTPGDPSHFSFKLWERALRDPVEWYASHVPGPTAWWSERDVAAARADLMPSEFARLVLCEWAADDDKLTSLEDIRALITHERFLEPMPGRRYMLSLDVGTRRDATVLACGHLERSPSPRVVVDRVQRWLPRKGTEVDLASVRETIIEWSRAYNNAELVFDPSQAVLLAQELAPANVRATRWEFTASNINRMARGLFGAIRDRTLALPDCEELIAELGAVLFIERGPGQFRIDHTASGHDDQAIAVGLLVDVLLANVSGERERKRALARSISVAGLEKASGWV